MKQAIADAVKQIQQIYPAPPPESLIRTVVGMLIGTRALATLFYLLERYFPEQAGQPASPPSSSPTSAATGLTA